MSNQLHDDIFRFLFNNFEAYSLDSSKMIGNFSEVFNPKLNWFIYN